MQNATNNRCFIYTRVGTSEQRPDDMSLDAQREILKQFAARTGAPVVLDFSEVASGGGKGARRAELERLLDAVRPGDIVAVSRLDRLSHDPETAIRDLGRVLRKGARFISIAEGEFDGSPAADLELSILACVARKG